MLGPIGVECRSRRRSSSVLPDSCVVLSMALMVLTWCSMKPLDLGSGLMRLCGQCDCTGETAQSHQK